MEVGCQLCHQLAEARLRVEDGALAVTCQRCGGTFRVPLIPDGDPPAPPAAAPPADPTPRCPKCETPRVGDGPCPRCGLAPAHAEAWRARHAEAPTASLGAAWDAALAAWSDESAHDRAAAIATETGDYAWLAARYRAVVRERPADALARRRLDGLARRAEATLRATAAPPARERATAARIPYVVLLAVVFVVGAGLLYARHALDQRQQDTRGGKVERIAPLPSRR